MPVSIHPRTYLLVDRGTKLVGLVAIVAGLGGLAGSLSPWLVVAGLVLGVATVFVEVDGS